MTKSSSERIDRTKLSSISFELPFQPPSSLCARSAIQDIVEERHRATERLSRKDVREL
jgi:hypothetical protein